MRPLAAQAFPALRLSKPPRLAAPCCWIRSGRVRQSRDARRCRWSSSDTSPKAPEKPFYITTPVFYVNDAPHIGHLYSTVLADVLKRWQQLKGRPALLCTGTDEHGIKIQQAAADKGVQPAELCGNNSDKFRKLAATANISHDFFVRTTDEQHKKAVEYFWLQLKHAVPKALGLYKDTHKGWYCVSDECFYPAGLVRPSIVPQTGKKMMVSLETKNEVEWVEEETWFFPLTKYKGALLKFYDANPDWITPAHRMKEVRNWVENHLEDLSITRPISRLSWGIADPENDKQIIYVWVDALVNYLTKAGYAEKWHSPKDDTGPWPADVHVIGKDILRFHAIYWPAFLMALELPLPKKILCHNHWTMSNRKMSKSLGNVVNPFLALQRWDIDPLRYFLMRNSSLSKDMAYSNQLIGSVYSKELQACLGNVLCRVARSRLNNGWTTEEAVRTFRNGELRELLNMKEWEDSQARFFSLRSYLEQVPSTFMEAMDNYDLGGAIREIGDLLAQTNRYLTYAEPWHLAKSSEPGARTLLNWVIFNSAEALRITGILLQPIMPTKASTLLDELGVRPDRRTIEYAQTGKDADYGTRPVHSMGTERRAAKFKTLFPPTLDQHETDRKLAEQAKALMGRKTNNKMNQLSEVLALEAELGKETVAEMLARAHAAKIAWIKSQAPL